MDQEARHRRDERNQAVAEMTAERPLRCAVCQQTPAELFHVPTGHVFCQNLECPLVQYSHVTQ